MTKQQSEGEVHVEAMRLILAAMERREDPPDWTILTHMLGMLDTIFQGIEDQRRDDQDELFHTRQDLDAKQAEMLGAVGHLRQDRDHWKQERQDAIEAGELMLAEIEALRKQLDAAQREAIDEFIERQECESAWQQQLDAAQAEIEALRQQLDAAKVYDGSTVAQWHQKACAHSAELRAIWTQMMRVHITFSEDTSLVQSVQILRESHDAALAEIETLRKQLADAQREASDEFAERQVLQHEASDDYVELARLRAFAAQVRSVVESEWYGVEMPAVRELLAQLDARTIKPVPVAEPLDAEGGA
jgi:chromosome segregation ATPase